MVLDGAFLEQSLLVREIYILFPFCSLSTAVPGGMGGIWCHLGLANFSGVLRRHEKLASNKSSMLAPQAKTLKWRTTVNLI